jgi:hypothetical protein
VEFTLRISAMNRASLEHIVRPIAAGLVLMLTLLLVLGTAIRDPRPHDLPVGIVAPPPLAQQLIQGFGQHAPGAFAFTTYGTEADALAAVDRRDVDAALVVGPAGPRLVVAGAAGDAVAGGITAAFTGAFAAQGTALPVDVVHLFTAGDPHGIVLFFLILATLVSSVIVGALAALGTTDRSWTVPLGVVAVYAASAGVVGTLTAAWLAGGYGDGLWLAMGVVTLLSFAVAVVVAGLARLLGPAGVALGALVVVFLGLVSSGGPLGTAFLPDAYRAIAPWLPVAPAANALRGALFFGGAGIAVPFLVLAGWAVLGVAVLAARDVVAPATRRAAVATA